MRCVFCYKKLSSLLINGCVLTCSSVICHLEFNRIPDLEMFDVTGELTEVEEETCLSLAALDEPIRMQKFLDNPGLTSTQIRRVVITVAA